MSLTLTAADLWPIIAAEIGLNVDDRDNSGDEEVEKRLPALWEQYADKGTVSERLRYLYVKRACIDFVRGGTRHRVDTTNAGEIATLDRQRFLNLTEMRKEVTDEIGRIEAVVGVTAGSARTRGAYSVTPARA